MISRVATLPQLHRLQRPLRGVVGRSLLRVPLHLPRSCPSHIPRQVAFLHTSRAVRYAPPGSGGNSRSGDDENSDGKSLKQDVESVDEFEEQSKVVPGPESEHSLQDKSDGGDPVSFASEAEETEEPPITTSERLLPIQLQYRPVFPGMASHFVSNDLRLITAVRKLRDTNLWNHNVVAFMSKRPIQTTQLVQNTDDIYEVGCACILQNVVISHGGTADGKYSVHGVLFPKFRARAGELVETVRGTPPGPDPTDAVVVQWMKGVQAVSNEPFAIQDEQVQGLSKKIIEGLDEMSKLNQAVRSEVQRFASVAPLQSPGGVVPQPDFLADFAASLIPKNEGLQEILEMTNVKQRLRTVAELVGKEVAYMHVQEGIYRYGHDQTQQRNREMILHEYLRYIKKELGLEGDDKSRLADKFQERIDDLDMPKDVRRVFDEEMNKFRSLEPNASEYNTVRSYLDWLSQLPWGKFSTDNFVIKEARGILDKSHYGLEDVKNRILEFLAVSKLSGSVDGKIICLAGPPGVGKTSIARAVADALGRKFDRFSVGGLYDVSEIKGHRRTYVASMPGRIVQALKKTQTLNPVILIDEVDKLGRLGSHGDPAAALLEVLDPEQNKAFQDTYLEVPIDLSRVLFVCTANNLDSIPAPLMDRMEVIHVPGYLPAEKVAIAANYLTPKARKESGLGAADVSISNEALERLVMRYTRESGVRGLAKSIEKIFRKLAFQYVKDAEEALAQAKPAQETKGSETPELSKEMDIENFKLAVNALDLVKFVGPPAHSSDRLYEELVPGVAMGLGWTPAGGVPLFIESVIQEALNSKTTPKFTRTGQLGEVMNESTAIAYSFSRMFMTKRFPRNKFLDHAVVHMHFPEGAIKKDGPSAGVAMATSLISLAMDIPANNHVAMTGELTLTGKVLQIGGLREKAVAAKTMGARIIVFPEDNWAEWEDLPAAVKEGMEARPVSDFHQVFDIAFGAVDPARVNAAWAELQTSRETKKTVQATTP